MENYITPTSKYDLAKMVNLQELGEQSILNCFIFILIN